MQDDSEKSYFRKLVVAIAVGTLFGVVSANVAPFTIGLFIDELGFSEERSGFLVSMELSVIAVTAVLISPLLDRFGFGRAALIGFTVVTIGQFGTLFLSSFSGLMSIRIWTAIGLGLVYAAANAAGVRARDPDRAFSLAIALSLTILAVLLPAVGVVVADFGYAGLTACVLAALVLVSPALRWLKRDVGPIEVAVVETGQADRAKVAILFLVVVLFNIGTGAAWAFMERVATGELGLSSEQVGFVIGASSVAGILGALSVSWFSKYFSRLFPLTIGILVGGVSCYLIASGLDATTFVIGAISYWGSYMLVYPYFFGIACDLDPSGRSAGATAGILMLSFAMGPLVGGYILANSNFAALAGTCLAFCVVAAVIIAPLILRIDSQRKSNAVPDA